MMKDDKGLHDRGQQREHSVNHGFKLGLLIGIPVGMLFYGWAQELGFF